MRLLVTGGTGFIGSRLTLAALRRGDEVRVLGQENHPPEAENARLLRDAGADLILGSVTDPETVTRAVAGMDAVVHLAAAQHEANVPDARFQDVNVTGTGRVLDAGIRAGVSRFVHGSTIGVYGGRPGETVTDDSPLEPTNIYGRTKLEGEHLVLAQRERVSVVLARISETYGPGDRRLLKLFRGIAKGRFFLVGNGENLHHLIYIDDLVDALLLAAAAPVPSGDTFVLAGPRPVSTREMVQQVARELGVSPPRVRVPLPVLLRTADLMEGMMRPLGVQPPLHRRRINFFLTSFAFSGERARASLGFIPQVGLEQGVRQTARWYLESGLLEARTAGASASNPAGATGAAGGNGGRALARGNGTRTPAQPAQEGGGHDQGRVGTIVRNEIKETPQISGKQPVDEPTDSDLAAKIEPFDSFWEAPEEVEKGYASFGRFYRWNYLPRFPRARDAAILVISCGPGYMVNVLREEGYTQVLGIDSDPEKIRPGLARGLNCRSARAFSFLREGAGVYDVIFCEQELNHLTKTEMLVFLGLCRNRLREGGLLVVHGLNGANPITGAEALAQNFDHYNSFTEYSFRQVLAHSGFSGAEVFPLHLYVFRGHPMSYVAWAASSLMNLAFRAAFILYGKSNRLWSKKIAATCARPVSTDVAAAGSSARPAPRN